MWKGMHESMLKFHIHQNMPRGFCYHNAAPPELGKIDIAHIFLP